MNFYIVTFDREATDAYKAFHETFVGNRNINKWWHYIKSAYILGTELSVDEIADHFAQSAKQHGLPTTHLVVRVVLRDSQGRLTKDAWDWITKNS